MTTHATTVDARVASEPVPIRAAALVLADGSVFEGESIGTAGIGRGEVVFNTAL